MTIGREYLDSTFYIDSQSQVVSSLAKEITANHKDPIERAISIYYWTRDKIVYDPYSSFSSNEEIFTESYKERYKASTIIEIKRGWCVQKACVLAALARALKIPSRLRFADIRNYCVPQKLKDQMGTNFFIFHGYTELFLDKKWVKATPAFNVELCEKFNLPPVEFDGVRDAVLAEKTSDGRKYIEYVNDRGTYSDFPFETILETLSSYYSFV